MFRFGQAKTNSGKVVVDQDLRSLQGETVLADIKHDAAIAITQLDIAGISALKRRRVDPAVPAFELFALASET